MRIMWAELCKLVDLWFIPSLRIVVAREKKSIFMDGCVRTHKCALLSVFGYIIMKINSVKSSLLIKLIYITFVCFSHS